MFRISVFSRSSAGDILFYFKRLSSVFITKPGATKEINNSFRAVIGMLYLSSVSSSVFGADFFPWVDPRCGLDDRFSGPGGMSSAGFPKNHSANSDCPFPAA
jgi:hypothetical protein